MVDKEIKVPVETNPMAKPGVEKVVAGDKPKGDKKWMLWGLIGFTVILLVTAVVLFMQLKKPEVSTPTPRPKTTPVLPEVNQVEPVSVCEVSFTIEELECTSITMSPTSSTVTVDELKTLTAQVTGGSGTYTHEWEVTSTGTDKGDLVPEDDNPTTWTAPDTLSSAQSWTITDTVTDTSTTPQIATCEVTVNFGGLSTCFDQCDSNADCEESYQCMSVGGTNRCVNPSCVEDSDCSCDDPTPSPTPTPTPGASPSPTPIPSPEVPGASPSPLARVEQPELPEAGSSTPVVLGVSVGVLLMVLGLLF